MPSNRDRFAGLAATAAVLAAVVVGFVSLGSPGTQRLVQMDNRRIQNISGIASTINRKWITSHQLPPSLDEIGPQNRDPLTNAPYEYRSGQESHYQLCATFARDYHPPQRRAPFWDHPAG